MIQNRYPVGRMPILFRLRKSGKNNIMNIENEKGRQNMLDLPGKRLRNCVMYMELTSLR